MAGENEGGQAVVVTPNVATSSDGQANAGVVSTDIAQGSGQETPGADAPPFGKVGDQEFKTEQEFKDWVARQEKGEPEPKVEAADEDAPKELTPEEREVKVTEIKANLKAAGGIYADERYENAAVEFELNNGEVSPETITSTAEAFGVPEDFVKEFINNAKLAREGAAAGSDAAVMKETQEFHEVVGGAANYKAFIDWAKGPEGGTGGLTKAQQDAYDDALATNPATAKVLLEGFYASYKASGEGPRPRDVTAEARRGESADRVQGYASKDDQMAAMRDPRYATSESYRKEVASKIAVSTYDQ